MEATRPEDKVEILSKIPNHAAFNSRLQLLLFDDLVPAWKHMDIAEQMQHVGHIVRWHGMSGRSGSQRRRMPGAPSPDPGAGAGAGGEIPEAQGDPDGTEH